MNDAEIGRAREATVTDAATMGSWALTLPFEGASVPKARQRLSADLHAQGIDESRIDDAVLVVSELVGNAVRHARPLASGGVEVRWRLNRTQLEIAVTDGGGATRPQTLHPPRAALGGRGLSIVEDLSTAWGVRTARNGAENAGHNHDGHPAGNRDESAADEATTVYATLPV